MNITSQTFSSSSLVLDGEAITRKRLRRMQSGVIAAARAIHNDLENDSDVEHFSSLVTLTYADGVEWSPKHITALVKHYREWFRRRGFTFRYVWTAELQQRGAVHYHIVMWLPLGNMPPMPDKQGWWPHGSTNCIIATSPVGYIAKYASKLETKAGVSLPKNLRLWGYGGLDIAQKAEIAWALCPRWLKQLIPHDDHPKQAERDMDIGAPGFPWPVIRKVRGWVSSLSGLFFASPFRTAEFTSAGMSVIHQGYVEALSPLGDQFRIPQSLK